MGLRNIVLSVLGVGVALCVVLAIAHPPAPWIPVGLYLAIGAVLILVERQRYRPTLRGGTFAPTGERYLDPVSGELVQVYFDAATGQRDYRPEPKDAT